MSEEVIKHIQVGREKKKLEEELIVGCIRFRKLFHRDFFPWLKVCTQYILHTPLESAECRDEICFVVFNLNTYKLRSEL